MARATAAGFFDRPVQVEDRRRHREVVMLVRREEKASDRAARGR
jgi:hypothetical protein